MLTREELQSYADKDYSITQLVSRTTYTRSQVVYACKKYDIKLRSKRKKYNVDHNKVKALLDSGFKISEIAQILKVNTRCIYNILYRNKWSKPRQYPTLRKPRENTVYGIKLDKIDTLEIVFQDRPRFEITIEHLECLLLKSFECENEDKIKYLILKKVK